MSPRFCQIGPHRIAYIRRGAGEPVLLLHGITTWSFIWRRVTALLAPRYDVVAIDLLGCGRSDKPLDVSYGLSAHADRLPAILDGLQLERVHLVGHDLGGGIAQIFAVRHPDRVRTLSLVNTVGFDLWPVQPITALRTPVIRQFLMAVCDLGGWRLVLRRALYHKERLTEGLLSLVTEPLRSPQGRKAFLHFARCLDNRDLLAITDDLGRLPMPTRILRGDADTYLPATISERLHAAIPRSRLRRIATAGHYIQEDEPGWLARRLLELFHEHGAPPARPEPGTGEGAAPRIACDTHHARS